MIEINYHSEDAWQKYFSVDLAEFYSCVAGFLNLRDSVVQQISDQTVGELIKESGLWKSVFFGGFTADESEPYYENALAKFYDEVFGIRVDNIGAIISRLKEGSTLESATKDIKPTIKEETPVLKKLSELKPKLETIYKILRDVVDKPNAKEYEIRDSFFGLNALRDVLNAGKKLLPLYLLREIILDIYSLFQIESLAKFFNIEDEFAKFVKINAGKLKQSIVVSQFSNVIDKIKGAGYSRTYFRPNGECKILDPFTFYYREGGSKIESGIVRLPYEHSLNYTEFFAFLAPIMFLDLAYVRPISEKEFYWCCLLGWER